MVKKFDLKEIYGSSKNVIDNAVNRKRMKLANFIFDITNSDLSEEEILNQIKKLYINLHRDWIDLVIVKKNDVLIKIYQRKKEID